MQIYKYCFDIYKYFLSTLNMKKIILIAFLVIVIGNVVAQKNSLTIKTGYTSSSIDYPTAGNLNFFEFGIGYTKKFSKFIWIGVEPGLKTAGYTGENRMGSLYFNSPIITSFNIGKGKLIVAPEIGFNPNFKLIKNIAPKSFSEGLFGIRLGYRLSEKIAFETYYRYGESFKSFAFDKVLTTNYITIQTRITLGKSTPVYQLLNRKQP